MNKIIQNRHALPLAVAALIMALITAWSLALHSGLDPLNGISFTGAVPAEHGSDVRTPEEFMTGAFEAVLRAILPAVRI